MSRGINNFDIYKLALRLEMFVFRVTDRLPKEEKYRSIDQLRRSSSSAADNISEAYHRFSYGDKINRMYIARGEAGETRDGMVRACQKGFISKTIAEFTYGKYTELIKGINGYIRYLNNQRYNKIVD